MYKLNLIAVFLLFYSACGNPSDHDSSQNKDNTENVIVHSSSTFIAPELLKKTGINLTSITQQDFEAVPFPDAEYRKSKALCEDSKGYKADQWEGLNECSWAAELERINAHNDLVSRNQNILTLKTAGGDSSFEHTPDGNNGIIYYRFKDYLAATNYFLIEEIINGQCMQSRLVSGKSGLQFDFKGTVNPASDDKHLIVYALNPDKAFKCSNKLEYYVLENEELIKKWHIPLMSNYIQELKFTNDKDLFLSYLKENNAARSLEYVKITL